MSSEMVGWLLCAGAAVCMDHARGEQSIRDLEHELVGFQIMSDTDQCDARREKFETSMRQYVDRCLEHMHVEETEVLPIAEKALTVHDWAELDAGLAADA